MMLGAKDTSWNGARTFLSNRGVLDQILEFEPRNLTKHKREELMLMISKNANSFQKTVIYRASKAAGPIAEWIKATVKFAEILETVKPLEDRLNAIKKRSQKATETINKLRADLGKVEQKVKQLRDNFSKKTREAMSLKAKLKKTEALIGHAKGLLDKLSGEKDRWGE